ncbi:hypothetical protein, partial [Bordetella avium]|uniref:hypothetical protein n=1 Tax=Bordetella avium TaxID=521 RepID=UPI001C70C0BB
IPNRTVKRLRADDSWFTPVKVGHRQAFIPQNPTSYRLWGFVFLSVARTSPVLEQTRERFKLSPPKLLLTSLSSG